MRLYFPLKRRKFDEIVVFSAGFENYSVLMRTRIFKFRRKSKISRIVAVLFYKKNFGRAHVCSPRRLPEIISKCYDCGNAAC